MCTGDTRRGAALGLALLGCALTARGAELLVFDWNKAVTKADHGFPWDSPPMASANGNWTSPVDYANGTLYYRAEIRSQPVAQSMKLQFCFWQDMNLQPNHLENCGPMENVQGTPGTVVTWSCAVQNMWKMDGKTIDWTRARDRNGVAIKNSSGNPVSDYAGWNWNGENPDEWYPLDMRFTVVVASPGAGFSGWDNYVGGGPANNPPTAQGASVTVAQDTQRVITLGYSDPDGPQPYAFEVTQGPSHGTLSGTGSSRTYAPHTGYAGSDSFKWKVKDGKDAWSNEATVSITVQPNAAPVAHDTSVSVKQGESASVTLKYTDADGPGPYTFAITQGPSHGTLSGTGGTRSYTPYASYSGTDSFDWKVNDGKADSGVATVTITVQPNQQPSVTDQSVDAVENTAVEIPLQFSDPDGPGPHVVSVVDHPGHGSVSVDGSTCTYTPGSGYSGPDSFTWKVSDGVRESAVATVTITVHEDSDGDGLPNWWETQYDLDPGRADTDGDGIEDGDEDEDLDGRTNVQEFFLGSDPYASDLSTDLGVFACSPAPMFRRDGPGVGGTAGALSFGLSASAVAILLFCIRGALPGVKSAPMSRRDRPGRRKGACRTVAAR